MRIYLFKDNMNKLDFTKENVHNAIVDLALKHSAYVEYDPFEGSFYFSYEASKNGHDILEDVTKKLKHSFKELKLSEGEVYEDYISFYSNILYADGDDVAENQDWINAAKDRGVVWTTIKYDDNDVDDY